MRVHERGAGITEACGTGACAAAWAADALGAGRPRRAGEITVHMDGGDAKVRLDDPDGRVMLIGPATFIAAVEVGASLTIKR